jgi:hypothetical protein
MSGEAGHQNIEWNPFEYVWDPYQLVAGSDLSSEVLRTEVKFENAIDFALCSICI